jgi:cell division protein FtsI (penicillin-binding protein 3)
MRDRAGPRRRAAGPAGVAFGAFYLTIGIRMGHLAASEPMEPVASAPGAEIVAQRADIVDRNGRILATNMTTTRFMRIPRTWWTPRAPPANWPRSSPNWTPPTLERRFTDGRSSSGSARCCRPNRCRRCTRSAIPACLFGPREMRLYPNGTLGRPCAGRLSFGAEGVHSAEVIGTAGIEKALDARLRDPAQGGTPLELSLDLTVQATVEEVLRPASPC